VTYWFVIHHPVDQIVEYRITCSMSIEPVAIFVEISLDILLTNMMMNAAQPSFQLLYKPVHKVKIDTRVTFAFPILQSFINGMFPFH